uniref:Odorant receptor n=1 Tax=Brugia timori TaxID=42155 RepID=A0A0R3Q7H8_9BILA
LRLNYVICNKFHFIEINIILSQFISTFLSVAYTFFFPLYGA